VEDTKAVKVNSEECRIDPSVMVCDLSLNAKGPMEDEAFINDPVLWANIRRGNTLLDIYDPNDFEKLENQVIARKGLTKFFDMKFNYIS
jgi:hypothetical protein